MLSVVGVLSAYVGLGCLPPSGLGRADFGSPRTIGAGQYCWGGVDSR